VTRYRISYAARSDIINILAWTRDQFAKRAANATSG
jgi:plasmid stabilization system protein ParE